MGYKELLLRYEALSRALQQQLGLLPGAASADGGSSNSGSPAGAADLSTSPGHRSKGQQAAQGFGSLVLTVSDTGIGHARRVISAPIAVAAPAGGPTAGLVPSSADASPSGKWSPGGILQRISKGASAARRSITPPRDRRGGRTAAAAEAASAAAESASRSPSSSRAASPGGKAGQPFFSTLFGSPKNASPQQQAAEQQAQAATAVGEQPGEVQPAVQQPMAPDSEAGEPAAALAGGSAEPAPELSFAEGLVSPADTRDAPNAAAADLPLEAEGEPQAVLHAADTGGVDQLLGRAPVQQQQQQPDEQQSVLLEAAAAPQQEEGAAGSSASDLIQLGTSKSSSQQPAAADAAAGPDLLLPLGGPSEAEQLPEGRDAQPDTSLI